MYQKELNAIRACVNRAHADLKKAGEVMRTSAAPDDFFADCGEAIHAVEKLAKTVRETGPDEFIGD